MIRNDFVSNSSSSSFIVEVNENSRCYDLNISILSHVLNNILFIPKLECYSDGLIEKVKRNPDIFTIYGNTIYSNNSIELKKPSDNIINDSLSILIQDIINESKSFICDFGIDDCGEYTSLATQIATTLELQYNFNCKQDEGFCYSSVDRLFKFRKG